MCGNGGDRDTFCTGCRTHRTLHNGRFQLFADFESPFWSEFISALAPILACCCGEANSVPATASTRVMRRQTPVSGDRLNRVLSNCSLAGLGRQFRHLPVARQVAEQDLPRLKECTLSYLKRFERKRRKTDQENSRDHFGKYYSRSWDTLRLFRTKSGNQDNSLGDSVFEAMSAICQRAVE